MGKFGGQSFGARLSLKLNQIEDAPKATIEVWQSIFNELLPSMLDVSPLMAMELFQSHLTGTASKEFEQICYDAAGDLYDNHIARSSINGCQNMTPWTSLMLERAATASTSFWTNIYRRTLKQLDLGYSKMRLVSWVEVRLQV